jgi:DoxX-like family
MTRDRSVSALLILQWVLGLVILWESVHFALSAKAASEFAKTGLPNFIRIALAWIEIAAALLFLIPRATVAGGWLLLGVLAAAIVLHLLHGWYDAGALLVYAAATWGVMAGQHVRVSGRGQL